MLLSPIPYLVYITPSIRTITTHKDRYIHIYTHSQSNSCCTSFFEFICIDFVHHFSIQCVFLYFCDWKMNSMRWLGLPIIGFMLMAILEVSRGQGLAAAPSPAPNSPTSDGSAIDQGVAYVLLLVALAITYLIH